MPAPVVASITDTALADSTSRPVDMPATVNADDLLIVLLSLNSLPGTPTTPTGWTLGDYQQTAGRDGLGVFLKKADGTEGGTSPDFSTTFNSQGTAHVYRITGWAGDLTNDTEVANIVTSDGNPDCPSVDLSGATRPSLFIAVANCDDDHSTATAPTNYTDVHQSTNGTATSGATLVSARRVLSATTTDPGAFGTLSGDCHVTTIAIRGTPGGGGGGSGRGGGSGGGGGGGGGGNPGGPKPKPDGQFATGIRLRVRGSVGF